MSTAKVVNIQHPSSGNINMMTDSTGSITLPVVPFIRNIPTITTDYTISTTYNEMSVGPIEIANNITVNVAGEWVIV
jgi:hypothetical protein